IRRRRLILHRASSATSNTRSSRIGALPSRSRTWIAAASRRRCSRCRIPCNNQEARAMARGWNEFMAQMAADHPGRFGIFAALPILDIDGSLKEIEYALDTLKADGVALMTNIGDKWLGDPYYAPVFEELNRRGTILYTHPVAPNCCRDLLPELNDSVIE